MHLSDLEVVLHKSALHVKELDFITPISAHPHLDVNPLAERQGKGIGSEFKVILVKLEEKLSYVGT